MSYSILRGYSFRLVLSLCGPVEDVVVNVVVSGLIRLRQTTSAWIVIWTLTGHSNAVQKVDNVNMTVGDCFLNRLHSAHRPDAVQVFDDFKVTVRGSTSHGGFGALSPMLWRYFTTSRCPLAAAYVISLSPHVAPIEYRYFRTSRRPTPYMTDTEYLSERFS